MTFTKECVKIQTIINLEAEKGRSNCLWMPKRGDGGENLRRSVSEAVLELQAEQVKPL